MKIDKIYLDNLLKKEIETSKELYEINPEKYLDKYLPIYSETLSDLQNFKYSDKEKKLFALYYANGVYNIEQNEL